MGRVRIIVHHVEGIPGGLPAVWTQDPDRKGPGTIVHLYLRADLEVAAADHFRAMAIRDCMPEATWDDFTVVDGAQPQLRAVSA